MWWKAGSDWKWHVQSIFPYNNSPQYHYEREHERGLLDRRAFSLVWQHVVSSKAMAPPQVSDKLNLFSFRVTQVFRRRRSRIADGAWNSWIFRSCPGAVSIHSDNRFIAHPTSSWMDWLVDWGSRRFNVWVHNEGWKIWVLLFLPSPMKGGSMEERNVLRSKSQCCSSFGWVSFCEAWDKGGQLSYS